MSASKASMARRVGLVALVGGGLFALQQQRVAAAKAAKRRKAALVAESAAADADANADADVDPQTQAKKKKKKKENPMVQIFWRLWPFMHSKSDLAKDGDANAGQLELVAIFVASVLRTWHSNRMVYVKADLMKVTYSRDMALFRKIIRDTVVLSVLSSLIFATHRYLKERLTLVWREKLTRQLHRRYFRSMNYYKISHMNQGKIADVEERITRDPRRFCKGLADEMEKLSAAMTSGVWFTYKLTTISSLPFAVSPLVYFYVAFRASVSLAPNWSKRWRGMLDRRGVYQKRQARLLTHSEAICAYQGNDLEKAIINESWHEFLRYCVHFVRDASLFHFVTSALFEYGGHSFAEALIVGRYISPASPLKQALLAAKTPAEKVAANGALFSHIRFLTELYIRAMSSQGTVISVLRTLQNMVGPAKRLTELFDTLEDFEQQKETSATFKNNMERIEFKDVQVFTPTGHLLVKDLNFHLDKGTSMLLTGTNGSGKSSIFRCLGALWSVPAGGVITKPGGGEPGLNKTTFYLPQKPYNVLGTLRDQLIYPETADNAASIPEAELQTLLDKVDLGYLAERAGNQNQNQDAKGGKGKDKGKGKGKGTEVKDKEVNWDNVLSLGEKQRLAIARLLYHRPTFAILDECTSGVSASMERRLYETCEAEGITCITISHRPVLRQFHDVVLNILADGEGGWEWSETERGKAKMEAKAQKALEAEKAEKAQGKAGKAGKGKGGKEEEGKESAAESAVIREVARAGADSGEAAAGGYNAAYYAEKGGGDALLERQRLKERSQKYVDGAAALKAASQRLAKVGDGGLPKVAMRQRLADVVTKFMPDGASLKDPEMHRVLLLAGLVVGKTLLADAIARYDGYIVSSIVLQNDFWVFARAVASGAFFRTFLSVFDAQMMLHKWYLNLEWRRRLTKYLMDLYFKVNTFYDIKNHDDRIADPDERIAEQVEALSIALTELWTSLLKPAFDISFNTVMLYRTLGTSGVTYTTGYMLASMFLMNKVVPNFRTIRRTEFDLEGRYRFVHNRLVEHTESVGFLGGDEVELGIADRRLEALSAHIEASQFQTLRFNIFNNFTIKQTPDLFAFGLRMLYAQSFGSDSAVLQGDGSEISRNGEYIQQTIMRSFKSFGDAFDLTETIGSFIGTLENVTDFMYVVEEIAANQERHKAALESHVALADEGALVPSADGSIEFSGVDIVAPGNICVASNLSFKVEAGKGIVISGPNAAGKSSCFRVLGGLWPLAKGTIARPCNEHGVVTPKEVFLVPQKPYSVTGSLADQVTYPDVIGKDEFSAADDEHLRSLLRLVRVEYLVDREGGWDATAKWEDTLSLGEQQRIGMARLFYHGPKYAILDECTSAVSINIEKELYAAAKRRGITCITISQRLALEEFHHAELAMGDSEGPDGWSYRLLHEDN